MLATTGSAGAQEVTWRSNYEAARREARQANRPMLLDFVSDDCFWCTKLDGTTFRDPAVVALLNDRFVPLKVHAEKNAALTEALAVRGFPTLVLADPDGKVLETLEGYADAARLLGRLRQALGNGPTAAPHVARDARTPVAESPAVTSHPQPDTKSKTRDAAVDRDQTSPESSPPGVSLKADPKAQQRMSRAAELLVQAREDYRTGQYLCCLDRCELLAAEFADLPEGAQAIALAAEIKNNPQWMRLVCESLSDRLGFLYLSLAETLLQQGQPRQAVDCLERIVQGFPGSRQAEAASTRLAQIRPARRTEVQKPPR